MFLLDIHVFPCWIGIAAADLLRYMMLGGGVYDTWDDGVDGGLCSSRARLLSWVF